MFLFDDTGDWVVWCALVLLVAMLLLLAFAIGGYDPGSQGDDAGNQPGRHKEPPHYTLDDWT